MSEKHRYTSVANAMESGTVKTPACANCVRRAANGLEDLADCKVVASVMVAVVVCTVSSKFLLQFRQCSNFQSLRYKLIG
jgi:hypothetical protein